MHASTASSYPVCTTDANSNQRRVLSLRESAGVAAARTDRSARRRRHAGLSRAEALVPAPRRERREPQRQLHLSRCVGNTVTDDASARSAAATSSPTIRRSTAATARRTGAHRQPHRRASRRRSSTNAALRVARVGLAVSGILNARSGSWLTVTTGRDIALHRHQRPARQPGARRPVRRQDAEQLPEPGRVRLPGAGHARRITPQQHHGPGFWTIDLALARGSPFGAAQNLELRVEAFNLLNHFNWGNPQTNFDAGTFGRIPTQTGDPAHHAVRREVRFLD